LRFSAASLPPTKSPSLFPFFGFFVSGSILGEGNNRFAISCTFLKKSLIISILTSFSPLFLISATMVTLINISMSLGLQFNTFAASSMLIHALL
jgi:hypothetical protein